MHIGLSQGLAAGDGYPGHTMFFNLCNNFIGAHDTSAGKRVFTVTIVASQRATGEPHENRRQPYRIGFTLQGKKNLRDAQRHSLLRGERGHGDLLQIRSVLAARPAAELSGYSR